MTYFLDASAFVKRYVREPGSDRVHALVKRQVPLLISRLSTVEVPSGLWKRSRVGDISVADARRLVSRFASDAAHVTIVEPRAATLDLAVDLVERHPLRAYDAVQLASALRWTRETGVALAFVCADARVATAALAEKVRAIVLR